MSTNSGPCKVRCSPAAGVVGAGPECHPDGPRAFWDPDVKAAADARRAEAETKEAGAAEAKANLRRDALLKIVGRDLGKRYTQDLASLETFREYRDPPYCAKQREVLARLRRIEAHIADFVSGFGGLLFLGAVGTGKNHLAAAMLYAAARQGISCRAINAQRLNGLVRNAMSTGDPPELLMRRLVEPQVLAISDPVPPKGDPTGWNVTHLFDLVEQRYAELRPTWITGNIRDDQHGTQQLTAAVWDRLREGAEVLRCDWPSYRTQRSLMH